MRRAVFIKQIELLTCVSMIDCEYFGQRLQSSVNFAFDRFANKNCQCFVSSAMRDIEFGEVNLVGGIVGCLLAY